MTKKNSYYSPQGGLPPQTQLLSDRAVLTDAYAIIPKRVMTDIVTSFLPFWQGMRMWVIARPLSGFSETFSQYIVEIEPDGGSEKPELDPAAEGVLFVVAGEMDITIEGEKHHMTEGGYAFYHQNATGQCITIMINRCVFIGCEKLINTLKV